jgi:hypothetical protein
VTKSVWRVILLKIFLKKNVSGLTFKKIKRYPRCLETISNVIVTIKAGRDNPYFKIILKHSVN